MIRMEIALFLILAMVAAFYFSTPRIHSPLHETFSILLVAVLFHLILDTITVFTVNNLDLVPVFLNDTIHRLFIGTLIIVEYLFYQYMSNLIQEDAGQLTFLDHIARFFLIIFETGVLTLPIHYAVTPEGNYSDGIHANLCYIGVTFYITLCLLMLIRHHKKIRLIAGSTITVALLIEILVCIIQGLHPSWLISGMGITLVTMTFYLILENPDKLRAELIEQKMSMLYLKSQVNPHFLYNTLDSIRIQAQLDGDDKVAHLLMRLVDFFRLNIRSDQQMVTLDHEMELIDAYMELMCTRYPSITSINDCPEELLDYVVPNFILQPLVENSLLHGLKNKGYQGTVRVVVEQIDEAQMEIRIEDSGTGFTDEVRERINGSLLLWKRQSEKTEGNHIGISNVQRRIHLLCGSEYGLSYSENTDGGVIAHIRLPLTMEELQ